MGEFLIAMLFGFPAVCLSLLVSAIGIRKENFWLVIVGAVLFVPFTYYLYGAPGSAGLPILLPLLHFGSAVAVYKKNKRWAWLLLAPSFLVTLWVAGLALFYQARP